jgi:hypothetical protein
MIKLRRIRLSVFEGIPSVARLAMELIERCQWTARLAAQEAVVLAAERGAWIGSKSPANFDTAVNRVQAAIIRCRRRPNEEEERQATIGDTGSMLHVRIPDGRVIREPRQMRVLASGDHIVADDLFWRRRVLSGDVALIERQPRR